MKYFLIEGSLKNPLPVGQEELENIIMDHLHYMEEGFSEGWILLSGPKTSRKGGFVLMKGESQEEVEAYFARDPMKVAGVQEYRVIEFLLHDCQPSLKSWFR